MPPLRASAFAAAEQFHAEIALMPDGFHIEVIATQNAFHCRHIPVIKHRVVLDGIFHVELGVLADAHFVVGEQINTL